MFALVQALATHLATLAEAVEMEKYPEFQVWVRYPRRYLEDWELKQKFFF